MDLFDSKYIRSVTIAVGLMVFQQIGGINGVGFYASQTFVAAGMSSGNIGTIAYALIQVPITVVGAFLMDRSGRRPLQMVYVASFSIGMGTVPWVIMSEILCRDTHIDEVIFNRLVEMAKHEGYDVIKLCKTPQANPPPESEEKPTDSFGGSNPFSANRGVRIKGKSHVLASVLPVCRNI